MKEDLEDPGAVQKKMLLIFVVTAASSLLWLGGILLAPYLASRSSPWADLAYFFYRPVCHQIADRSLVGFGQPLAVCARCTGIYLGFLVGLGIYPFIRGWRRPALPSGRLFWLVSVPIGLDTAAHFLGLWDTSNTARLATGILWGIILPFYAMSGIADLVLSRKKRLKSARKCP
jgi:uncharacterized membrane protein